MDKVISMIVIVDRTRRRSAEMLSEKQRQELLTVMRDIGPEGAARASGSSRGALLRAAAGLPVLRGTIALIDRYLATLRRHGADAA
jgi:hypothetical protein